MASAATLPTHEVPLADLAGVSRGSGEDASCLQAREQAAALLAPLMLPDRARHLWRYTDPGRFLPKVDPTGVPALDFSPVWRRDEELSAAAHIGAGAVRLVEVDPAAAAAGVTVEDLHKADVGSLLGALVPASHGFVEAINAAAWRGGVIVRVPPRVELEHPIRVRCEVGPIPVSLPRVIVVAGEGSAFEVVEGHVGGWANAQVLGVTELFIGPSARVRYDVVQRWEPGVTGHLTLRSRLEADASFQLALASFGGSVVKADVGSILAGHGGNAEMYGVAMGGDAQHFDHHTEHIHEAGKTFSNLDFKVALTDTARSAYTGMIRIVEDAGGSEAYQENRNLLLSEDARAESIPELEILTDDVRCSHGATVAPLDDEQLYYLKSRGLPHLQAMRLIVYGFLDQTLQRLPERTRERIQAMVAARLHTE